MPKREATQWPPASRSGPMRLLLEALAFGVVFIVVLGVLLIPYARSQGGVPILNATRIKHAYLDEHPPPRVIIVGGSNTLLGFHSPTIERRVGLPVANLGVHGGLGLDYMLREALLSAEEGDIVVLAPEYRRFMMSTRHGRPTAIAQVVERRPANARFLTPTHWKMLGDTGAMEQLGFALRYSRDLASGARAPRARPYNFREDLTPNGDLLVHWGKPTRSEWIRPRDPFNLRDEAEVRRAIEHINRYIEALRRRGARVVFTYPPIADIHFEPRASEHREFHRLLVSTLDCDVLGGFGENVYPLEQFFNTATHLSGEGAVARSERVGDDLARWIERNKGSDPRGGS